MLSASDITQSPAWFPLEPGASGTLRWVRLSESGYSAASFLDQRLLAARPEEACCERAVAEAAAAQLMPRSHYVFHTGHVGSTLISRLIGAHAAYFALREPALLRHMASAEAPSPVSLAELLAFFDGAIVAAVMGYGLDSGAIQAAVGALLDAQHVS